MKTDTVLLCEQCLNDAGTLVASELDITDCRKIENAHGRLFCSYREVQPQPAPEDSHASVNEPTASTASTAEPAVDSVDNDDDGLPPGSYRNNCTGCELRHDGQILACDSCKRDNGTNLYTVADTSQCNYFVNKNGLLRCDKSRSDKM